MERHRVRHFNVPFRRRRMANQRQTTLENDQGSTTESLKENLCTPTNRPSWTVGKMLVFFLNNLNTLLTFYRIEPLLFNGHNKPGELKHAALTTPLLSSSPTSSRWAPFSRNASNYLLYICRVGPT